MRYLYTTKPDELCHEVEKGIYGRPVHTSQQRKLRKLGWVYNISDLRGTDHVRQGQEEGQEGQEVTDDREMWAAAYEQKFGKPPHHKAKVETIRKRVESDD